MITRRRALSLLAAAPLVAQAACKRSTRLRIGSKNFSESVLLGEILTQQLARRGIAADHKESLGGTFVCHQAMLSADLDAYVEYTGTGLVAILKDERDPPLTDPAQVRAAVERGYAEKFAISWLPALGFDDTFAILVRRADAKEHALSKVSDLASRASQMRAGFGYEFVERGDCAGFMKAYGLTFRDPPMTMELGLTYRALAQSTVDVIAGNSTSGLVDKLDLVQLADDKRFFPPYEAAPLVRKAILDARPEVSEALSVLAGKIDTKRMRAMNQAIDADGRAPADVARELIASLG